MRRPGLLVGWDPASLARPRETYDPFREAISPSFAAIFDWNPAVSLYVDQVGGIAFAASGTAPVLASSGGLPCVSFDGAGALVATSSPFAALSDLSGGVSIYVVAERTDAAATAKALLGIGRDTGTTDNFDIVSAAWNATNVSLNVYDSAGGATLDTTTDPGRNTVSVLSLHATTTARTAKLNGVGAAEASGATRDPAGMDFFSIGASLLFSASPPLLTVAFPGRIYRVLICEGAYDAAVLAYLQGLYSPARIPPGVASSDVLFLWDPAASYTRDWAGTWQTLTPNGTITQTVRNGQPCAEFAADTAYYEGVAPFAAFAGVVPVTHIAVGEIQSGSAGALSLYMSSGGLTSNSFYAFLRTTGGGAAVALWAPIASDYSGPVATVGKVHSLVVSVESSLLTAYMDGAGNAGTAHATSPASLTTLRIGSAGTQAAAGTFAPSRWYYQALLRGSYSAAELHAWLAANFPVGDTA